MHDPKYKLKQGKAFGLFGLHLASDKLMCVCVTIVCVSSPHGLEIWLTFATSILLNRPSFAHLALCSDIFFERGN